MPARPAARPVTGPVTLAVAMVAAVGGCTLARSSDHQERPRAPQGPVTVARHVAPITTLSPRPSCAEVRHGFEPRRISIPGATRGAVVITPPRDSRGIPGVPPLTTAGKSLFAWDREQGIRPGDPAGNVLLNAHTWPDGSALGNRLLAALHRGDRIVVHGVRTRLCYRVTERVEVLAERGLPRYYTKDGPPQLAILVCSGRRLAPGVWEKRTVWFAAPSA